MSRITAVLRLAPPQGRARPRSAARTRYSLLLASETAAGHEPECRGPAVLQTGVLGPEKTCCLHLWSRLLHSFFLARAQALRTPAPACPQSAPRASARGCTLALADWPADFYVQPLPRATSGRTVIDRRHSLSSTGGAGRCASSSGPRIWRLFRIERISVSHVQRPRTRRRSHTRSVDKKRDFSSVLPSTKAPSQGKAPSSRLWLGALPSRPVAMPARLCALSQRGFPFRGLLRAKPT